ncbi:MAG: fibrobacter succinogenes major paralogous domain-containing protein [Candidatus Fibromonas sp.]|jgi:uncharacterized protein (TIGR02145 family)|nr:fibrobacter succinogenes major paralogous domain-containing protein [Candidatus Fibromonas sp.]
MFIFLAALFLFTHAAAQLAPLQYGGQTYKTARIGTQTWMAENLNYEAEGSLCYENISAGCTIYGRLYNWQTAMKVCPKGWHLPGNADWDKLLRFVDGDKGTESPYGSKTAGKHLKAARGWDIYEYKGYKGSGTDKYGFSALPGGYRSPDGKFSNLGDCGVWWSASEFDGSNAYNYGVFYIYEYVTFDRGGKSHLFSVRCIKD